MTKEEFENIINKTVSDEDFKLINFIYTFYPTISNTNGKQQISAIYTAGGMAVIHDMCKRAKIAADLDQRKRCYQARITDYNYKLEELSTCTDVDNFKYNDSLL